jgi:hypothetical protein
LIRVKGNGVLPADAPLASEPPDHSSPARFLTYIKRRRVAAASGALSWNERRNRSGFQLEGAVQRFVLQANIERYEALIEREADPDKKSRLQRLLDIERETLAALDLAERPLEPKI